MSNKFKYTIAIITCLLVGFLSGFATQSSVGSWYLNLEKPFFNPPGWIFGPVWTTLYVLMGIAVARIWSLGWEKINVKIAVYAFITQLTLNALWSVLFFGLQNPLAAFIEILFLLTAIIYTTLRFKKLDKVAAYLMYPYILWVSFATILNFSIVILNW